jgi:adenylate kinase family enzyme
MTPKTFLFIGRSGAGKGTQAKLLSEYIKGHAGNSLPVFYLETGSHFREFVKGESYTSQQAKILYDKAERQPDFLAVWNWGDIFVKQFTDSMHLIMDGMPRSLGEALMLRTAFDFYHISKPVVVYVNVKPEWSKDKLMKRHRSDDKGEAEIDKKISWFNHDVLPAIEYFKSDPFYHYVEVDGEQSIDKVHQDIVSAVAW